MPNLAVAPGEALRTGSGTPVEAGPDLDRPAGGEPDLRTILAERHRRCLPGLARMRALARGDEGVPIAPHVGPELDVAMAEVLAELAEAENALIAAQADTPRGSSIAGFLTARRQRLIVVSEQVLMAAGSGDVSALRQRLSQFHALASAMWQVQLGM